MVRLSLAFALLAPSLVAGCAQPGYGVVRVARSEYAVDFEIQEVYAFFSSGANVPRDPGLCFHTRVGDCELVDCRDPSTPSSWNSGARAGEIAVLVSGVPFALELHVDERGNTSYSADVAGLRAGAPLEVRATGEWAPAFHVEAVYPSTPELWLPERSEPGTPLRIEWAPPPDDPDLSIEVRAPLPGWRFFAPPEPYVLCTPPASDGSVTIPYELIGPLDIGHDLTPLSISASHSLTTLTRIGDFDLEVIASDHPTPVRVKR